jgi:hypothetical protein
MFPGTVFYERRRRRHALSERASALKKGSSGANRGTFPVRCAADGYNCLWCASMTGSSTLLARQLHAAIAGAAFQGVVRLHGSQRAKTIRREPLRGNVKASDQRLLDSGGASLG